MSTSFPAEGFRHIVRWVALLNLCYFGVEFAVASRVGSVSLFADSIDFLEDALVNLLIFAALGWTATHRARLGMGLAAILLAPGIATLWMEWSKFNLPVPPAPAALTLARNRISLRFTDVEIAVIEVRAAQRSTDRASWIKALVRRHLALKSRVDDGLLAELAPIRMQLLRIGRNLNQAMKAANASMLETGDKQIEPELRRIADMRMEISEQVTAVGEAMRGDASYWTVAD